jgi:predicted nuclease of predicted toxin-antitoxin system
LKYLADECFSGLLYQALLNADVDVVRSRDFIPAAADPEVLALAYRQGRVLLTEDNDFGDLVVRLGFQTRGIVRVALGTMPRSSRATRCTAAIVSLGVGAMDAIVTVEEHRTRVRKLK